MLHLIIYLSGDDLNHTFLLFCMFVPSFDIIVLSKLFDIKFHRGV